MKNRLFFFIAAVLLCMSWMLGGCGGNVVDSSSGEPGTNSFAFERLTHVEEPKWVPAYKNEPITTQGEENLYFLYTPETNTNGVYDITKMKECVYSAEDETWLPEGIADMEGWNQVSNAYYTSLYPCKEASAVLAWKAPEDGCFVLDVTFTFGNEAPGGDTDGVTLSIYGNTERVYSRSIADNLNEGDTLRTAVRLKAGQYLYIIADPNGNIAGDVCHSVRAELTKTLPYVDDETTWGFGASHPNGSGAEQGVNGWYYLYTEETNTGGVYNLDAVKECRYVGYTEDEKDPYTGRASGTWLPDIYEEKAMEEDGFVWRQTDGGYLQPFVLNGPHATAALAWEAPADGRYSFDVSSMVDSHLRHGAPENDGLTLSFYAHQKKIATEHYEENTWVGYKMEVSLKRGERFYLFADPGEVAAGDSVYELTIFVQKQD